MLYINIVYFWGAESKFCVSFELLPFPEPHMWPPKGCNVKFIQFENIIYHYCIFLWSRIYICYKIWAPSLPRVTNTTKKVVKVITIWFSNVIYKLCMFVGCRIWIFFMFWVSLYLKYKRRKWKSYYFGVWYTYE